MFTKLFSSITDSTIWREPDHVRLVWITMLAKSDKNGAVFASIPGLADASRIDLDKCQDALKRLSEPDPWSRSKEMEGRRICEIDGGWQLINHGKYKQIRNADERRIYIRDQVRKYRAKCKQSVNKNLNVNPSEAEADQRQIRLNKSICMAGEEILNYLNEKTGKKFQPVNGNLKFINARLKEGATIIQCKGVIDLKCKQWICDAKMNDFLRPKTLFNGENFAAYLGNIGIEQTKKESINQSWSKPVEEIIKEMKKL